MDYNNNLTPELLKYSLPDAVQNLLNRFNNKFTLNLFIINFENSTKSDYCELLLKMTDADFIALINCYKELGWPLPTIHINEYEHNYVKHFIRQVENYKVISSINNVGNKENSFMTLIHFDEDLLNHIGLINFNTNLSISKELEDFKHLFDIIAQVKVFLGNTKNQPAELQQGKDKPKKHTAKQYAVTYILDCYAKNNPPLWGQKTKLEKLINSEYTKGDLSGNTVYKNFKHLKKEDVEDEAGLIDLIGENWKNVVLDLSADTTALEKYIFKQYNV